MKIKKIFLKNVRNFNKISLNFNDEINVILGKNALGKTTILESIYCLGMCKSPRTNNLDFLIKENEQFFLIDGVVETQKREKTILFSYTEKAKKIVVDKKKVEKLSDYIGEFGVVYYQPNEIVDFLGSPQNRRKTIDAIISQISQQYLVALKLYNKVLKERNMALKSAHFRKSKQNVVLVEMLTEKLLELSKPLETMRKDFCDQINNFLGNIHEKFCFEEKLEIKYYSFLNDNDIASKLKNIIDEDIDAENTSFGIHKDDFEFVINNKNINKFCSQGQQKSAILSFKIAVVELFKKIKGEYPVLLLDDALSELDANRQNSLFELINSDVQVLITTTSLENIKSEIKEKSTIIDLMKGEDEDE